MIYQRRVLFAVLAVLLCLLPLPTTAIAQTGTKSPSWLDAMDRAADSLLTEQAPSVSHEAFRYTDDADSLQVHERESRRVSSELFPVFDSLAEMDFELAASHSNGSSSDTTNTSAALQSGVDGAITWAQANPPTVGPIDASAELFDGSIKSLPAKITVSSFYAELGFVTPTNVPPGFWTAGFCFWLLPDNSCLEVSVGVSGAVTRWIVAETLAGGGYDLIDSGDLIGLDLTPGAENIIALYVNGQTGEAVLMVNSYAPAMTSTLPRLGTGDVAATLTYGADAENEPGTFTMDTFGFSVWDLGAASGGSSAAPTTAGASGPVSFDQLKSQALAQQPVAGPLNANLVQSATTFPWSPAGVNLSDVFVSVSFVNPFDVSAPWDFGISIRYNDSNTDTRLILESTGMWYQTTGTNAPIASGQLASFAAGPGGINTIEIAALGNQGVFALNGQVVAEIDLTGSPTAGDVFASSGFYTSNVVEGRLVPALNLTVWALAAQPVATATTAAVVVQPTVPTVDPLVAFNQQKAGAMVQAPVAGPLSGMLVQSAATFPYALANVAMSDTYSTVTFLNPADVSVPWNVGVGVRFGASSTETRFILESTGMWQIALGGGAATATGQISSVNAAVGGSNTIEIVAYQNAGVVVVNGVVATQLDLSGSVEAGDIFIGAGFFGTGIVEGRVIPYQNFQVWSLGAAAQPVATTTGTGVGNPAVRVAGPLSGSITEDASTLFVTYAEVLLADFYATASFTVPTDVSAPWDIIFGFRSEPVNGDEYRFVVGSDGTWRLTYGLNQPWIATGTVTNLATTPGQVNVLEITVSGATGSARLNGVDLVTNLDLSGSQVASDVWVGTASTNGTTLPGRVIQYAAFEVWTLA